MNKIEIKGAIIPNNSIEAYKKRGRNTRPYKILNYRLLLNP